MTPDVRVAGRPAGDASLKPRMYTRVWRFRPAPGLEAEFRRVYGRSGAWVDLFQRGAGYLGTKLVAAEDSTGEYHTIDRWDSEAAWRTFLADHAAEYAALDQLCERLTISETLVCEGTDCDS